MDRKIVFINVNILNSFEENAPSFWVYLSGFIYIFVFVLFLFLFLFYFATLSLSYLKPYK